MIETGAKLAARRAYEQDAYLSNIDVILWRLFTLAYDDEQFPEAVRWCDVGAKRFPADPRFVDCRLTLMGTKAVSPEPALAWRLVDSLAKLTPESARRYATASGQVMTAAVLARAGLADSAKHVLGRARASAEIDPTRDLESERAFVWTLLGEKDSAFKALGTYLGANPNVASGFNSDNNWQWRSIADDPRFQRLVSTGKK